MLVVVANSQDYGQNDMAPFSYSIHPPPLPKTSRHTSRTFTLGEEKKHPTFPTRQWEHSQDAHAPAVGRNIDLPSFYRSLESPQ